jgi:hypothetical protein
MHRREPDQITWNKCYQLYFEAFREPKSVADQKKLARIMKKPLDPEIEKYLFEYDGFLRGLGRMSLSMFFFELLLRLPSDCIPTRRPGVSWRSLYSALAPEPLMYT